MIARRVVGIAVLLLAFGPAAAADEGSGEIGWGGWDKGFVLRSGDGRHRLVISNRVQVRFTQEEPEEGDDRGSFRVRRYKLKLEGHVFEHWKFALQANLAGGSVPGENDDLLEDAHFQYTKLALAQPWFGQGKAFFGRQQLTSSGKLQFVDRSIASERFSPDRQVGVALVGTNARETFEYNVGMYNGEGRNLRENLDDDFMWTGRVVWTPFGEVGLEESALDRPETSRLAVGVSGLTNGLVRTLTGDIEGEPVTVDVPGLDVTRGGLELAYKLGGFSAFAEWFTETADDARLDSLGIPEIVELDTDGGYVQAGWLFPGRRNEIAGRWAVLSPDTLESEDTTELGVAFGHFFHGHAHKLQADWRRLERDGDPAFDAHELRVQFQLSF